MFEGQALLIDCYELHWKCFVLGIGREEKRLQTVKTYFACSEEKHSLLMHVICVPRIDLYK